MLKRKLIWFSFVQMWKKEIELLDTGVLDCNNDLRWKLHGKYEKELHEREQYVAISWTIDDAVPHIVVTVNAAKRNVRDIFRICCSLGFSDITWIHLWIKPDAALTNSFITDSSNSFLYNTTRNRYFHRNPRLARSVSSFWERRTMFKHLFHNKEITLKIPMLDRITNFSLCDTRIGDNDDFFSFILSLLDWNERSDILLQRLQSWFQK